MREIHTDLITREVARLCQEANFFLGEELIEKFKKASELEESEIGREIFRQLEENAKIAEEERVPICQDTGYAVVFVKLGQDVHLIGDDLETAINKGVKLGYTEGYLRKSMVNDPLLRENTGDNTPAIIHVDVVPGDRLEITVAPKGGGSENMSAIRMLKPADGREGVKKFILETVDRAGPNPCPPLIVGVGIGGTFEKAALLAKKSLLRPVDVRNSKPHIATLEEELLREINRLGIGPQGLGGKITALAVNIEVFPCHIATLPVAVNLNCHAARHKTAII